MAIDNDCAKGRHKHSLLARWQYKTDQLENRYYGNKMLGRTRMVILGLGAADALDADAKAATILN